MASLLNFQVPLVFLILFSYRLVNASLTSPSSATNATDIHDIIPSYGLPLGLIPGNVKSYTLHDSGSFVVKLNSPCYVRFEGIDQLVYYGVDIRGKLSYGAVKEVSGIQGKVSFFWFPVTGIEASEDGEKIWFFVGPFYKTFPAVTFTDIPACGSKVSLRNPFKFVDSI
ncbi:hypothetical protein M5689_010534 [Euphorbia peplus]|nr:hypothetical protein M5689_010534 [Euphorbia peplus]